MEKLLERFLRYVKIDTESVPGLKQIPSTKKQFDLSNLLVEELKEIGLEEVIIDENCYVMATLPSNVDKEVPTIGFVAHVDTTPDFTGANVKPIVWENYDGKDLVLNKEEDIVLKTDNFPEIKAYKGQTVVTTDGTTLLGADDKAGVAEIMTAMDYLVQHPEIKHGKIRICFTPDEEVGAGADLFDVEKFDAEWAYTMDGGPMGEFEYENFNAAGAVVTFKGQNVHPGTALGKMVNAMNIAAKFATKLPDNETPETTSGYEGFFHLLGMNGSVEETKLEYIIRDHDRDLFEARKDHLKSLVKDFTKEYDKATIELSITDQYYNMKEKVAPNMHIVDLALEAMKELEIKPDVKAIRGGTDGARLSYMGLPCPNIFAGGHNMHSRFEYVPVPTMVEATKMIVKIAELNAK
ncbi:peptidase T [Flammeovirga kamogawensis]|uniref:Peptidase T n=1 Tax=Flammeovirga kamogawensis TaxID=373891 RepID=A0ABX8GRM5_9BACT|nr:peptidase T [Flammeovirga kamogawensis]MBB6463444.1 tripeptide aminopeptidase [Flammeovirga kamogawensis]QWG05630.1 peptidase T [Flammeovirga kamogawensis]TRX67461.1 peptidase T [Flammeovirga kamogawensis]